MNAAASALPDRREVATAGRMIAGSGGNGAWRKAALTTRLARRTLGAPATAFDVLLTAPPWLRWDAKWQAKLASAVALGAIGPQLTRSIDGAWLGGLAELAGEDTLDWAIRRHAGASDDGSSDADGIIAAQPQPTNEALAERGFAILAATLAPALVAYLPRPVTDIAVVPDPQHDQLVADAVALIGAQREQQEEPA